VVGFGSNNREQFVLPVATRSGGTGMRKITVKMVDYETLEAGKPYQVIVFHIERNGRRKHLYVKVRHLDVS
jgi:hypothetical protein